MSKMKSFRNVLGIVCLSVLLVGGLSLGKAQEEEKEKTRERAREEERLRDRERIMENEEKILEKYSERFGVDREILADLRAERLGYGEISHALVLSEKTGKTLDEIVAMRDTGKGWGQIADELGVKLRETTREVNRERRRINKELSREERRTFRHSWKEREKEREAIEERRRLEKEEPGKEYVPPERGRGRGGESGRGR
jgi:hypothetical protein